MSNSSQFLKDLEASLASVKNLIEKDFLPNLKNEFNLFYASFSSLYKIMLKESLLQEDAYRKEMKLTDIKLPSKEVFSSSRIKEEISVRISQLDANYEYILNYCPFTLDYLTLKRVPIFAELIKFLDWENLLSGATDFNTQLVSSTFNELAKEQHEITFQLVATTQKHLQTYTNKILQYLKSISEFQREFYKKTIRTTFLPHIQSDETLQNNPEEFLKQIGKVAKNKNQKMPLYRELIVEIANEDFSDDGELIKQNLLKKLGEIRPINVAVKKNEEPAIEILEKALKALVQCNTFMEESLVKLDADWYLCPQRRIPFIKKIMRALSKKNNEGERFCHLIYTDDEKGTQHKIIRNLSSFIEKRRILIAQCATLLKQFSSKKENLEEREEEKISELLTNYLVEYAKATKELNAFNDYFKAHVLPQNRSKLRGVRIEINAINSNIANARSLRNNYLTRSDAERKRGK